MSSSAIPDLSVVIPSYKSGERTIACLDSLESQNTQSNIEIILVESSNDSVIDKVIELFPNVIIHRSKTRKYCGGARNVGMFLVQANVVAFLDTDCTVDANWAEEVLKAHETDYLAVGGVIKNGDPKSLISWAYYFCEFNLWLPIDQRKEISEVAGCSLSIKRAAFNDYGPFVEGTYSSDTAFHWKLQKDNHNALLVPSINVYHTADYDLRGFLLHIFTHRRDFAGVMIREKNISTLERIVHAFLSPLLPLILAFVIFLRVLRSGSFQLEFFRSLPLLIMGLFARAAGEFVGFMENRN